VSLDFGFTLHRSRSAAQSVTVHNHTKAKVVVQWNIPMVHGMEEPESERAVSHHPAASVRASKDKEVITVDRAEKEMERLQAFVVSPMQSEINPGQSQSFEICFTPKQSNRNFLSELEAYVFFKNQRTFRLVNDHSLTPPWCLTVSALGHTFASGQLQSKAQFLGGSVHKGKLVFPCCYLQESTYQTVMIRNITNLPCTFRLETGWKLGGINYIRLSCFLTIHCYFCM
jgi:hypothetical protein